MKLKVAPGGAELAVSDENFAREYNAALVFQVVNAYRAGARSGTKAQKTRAEVRGGEIAVRGRLQLRRRDGRQGRDAWPARMDRAELRRGPHGAR